jgi:hypothetical protein
MQTATIADRVREAFPFDVVKLPLMGPDNARTTHYGLFRDDDNTCIGNAVRKGYETHTTDDVVALAEAASESFNADCTISAGFNDGHSLTIGPTREQRAAIYGTADNIFPRFILRAGYDGRAFSASLGFYRDVCKNLAIAVGTGRNYAVSIRHTSQLRQRMPELVETFRQLASGWDSVVTTAARMQAREIELAEFIRQVYPERAERTDAQRARDDNRTREIVRRMERERQATGRAAGSLERATIWEAYNAVTGWVQHDKQRKGRIDSFARAIAGLNDADTSRASDLALSLAS